MECYRSKSKTLGLLLLGVVMVAVSFFCTTLEHRPGAVVVGWLGISFFGLGSLVIAGDFFRTGPQIIIDEKGIEDRRWGSGPIPWEDVRAIWVASMESSKFLCVDVADPEPYLAAMPVYRRWLARRNPALGFPEITITFSGLSPSLEEACRYLERELGIPVQKS